jgi:hypothetical protein
MSRYLLRGLCVLGVCTSAACSIDVSGQETVLREEKRFTVAEGAELAIETFDGAVDVQAWDRNEVVVEIERRAANQPEAQALEVLATQEGTRLRIQARNPGGRRGDTIQIGGWNSPSVSFVVRMPQRGALQVRTADGPIAVRGVNGTIELHTGDGPVRGERLAGELTIRTGDGPISLGDVEGGIDLNTGDGGVELNGRLDALRISTGDGPVSVDARAGSVMKREWAINTGDGPVSLRLPSDFNAEIDAHSGDGPITASGIVSDTPREAREEGVLRGRVGSGGQLLRITTGDGPITITR